VHWGRVREAKDRGKKRPARRGRPDAFVVVTLSKRWLVDQLQVKYLLQDRAEYRGGAV
jgi:hypothetical protein